MKQYLLSKAYVLSKSLRFCLENGYIFRHSLSKLFRYRYKCFEQLTSANMHLNKDNIQAMRSLRAYTHRYYEMLIHTFLCAWSFASFRDILYIQLIGGIISKDEGTTVLLWSLTLNFDQILHSFSISRSYIGWGYLLRGWWCSSPQI